METDDASSVIAEGIMTKLIAHKEKERENVEALLAGQKHLTSNVRTLINSLDQILHMTTPKHTSSQSDMLHSCVSNAKALQKQLNAVQARLQRIQAHLGQQGAAVATLEHHQQQQQPPLQPAPKAAATATRQPQGTAGQQQQGQLNDATTAAGSLQPQTTQEHQQQQVHVTDAATATATATGSLQPQSTHEQQQQQHLPATQE